MSIFVNIDDFYEDGFASFKMTNNHYQVIKSILDKQKWVADEERVYTAIPDFLAERGVTEAGDGNGFGQYNKTRLNQLSKFPQEYIDFLKGFFLDPMVSSDWQEIYDLELRYFDIWDGAEATPWHFEASSDADLVFLIYLNDESSWQREWGGQLEIGKRVIADGSMVANFGNIDEMACVLPNNRTVAVMNNKKLNCLHRSVAMTEQRQRIVLTGEIKFNLKERFDQPSKMYTSFEK